MSNVTPIKDQQSKRATNAGDKVLAFAREHHVAIAVVVAAVVALYVLERYGNKSASGAAAE